MAMLRTFDYMGHFDQPNTVFLNAVDTGMTTARGKVEVEFASTATDLVQAELTLDPMEARALAEKLTRGADAAERGEGYVA